MSIHIFYAMTVNARFSTALTAAVMIRGSGGDFTTNGMRDDAEVLGMPLHVIDLSKVEYHTGALMEVGLEIEAVVAGGNAMLVLHEADAAAPGVLGAVARLIPARKREDAALAVVAVVADATRSDEIAGVLSAGIGVQEGAVLRKSLLDRIEAEARQAA